MLILYNIMSMPVIPNLQKYPDSTITLGASLMDTSGLTDIMHMHLTKLLTAIGFACQNLRSMSQMMKERQPWRPCMLDAGEEVRRIMLSSGGAGCPRIHTNSLSWPLLFTSLYYSRPRGNEPCPTSKHNGKVLMINGPISGGRHISRPPSCRMAAGFGSSQAPLTFALALACCAST